MKTIKTGAAALAMLALSQPQMGMAQDCVQEADIADAAIYAMPAMVSAIETKCASQLSADGYFATEGSALKERYSVLSTDAWPGASRLINVFASSGKDSNGKQVASMLDYMPEEAMRPFLNAMIEQELAKEIPLKECTNIERGFELVAPLPPENVGALLGFVMRMAGVDKPSICEVGSN